MDSGATSAAAAIQAVKYWPEPVGYHEVFADRSRDPYNQNYQDRRDRRETQSHNIHNRSGMISDRVREHV